ELNVIMPFAQEDFIAQSITPAGGSWLKRYEACVAAASSINYATEMHYVGDPDQFGYASKVAMGQAVLRAQYLGRAAKQLAVWDGGNSTGPAGTGADVAAWKSYGGDSHIIDAGAIVRNIAGSPNPDEALYKRRVAVILLIDLPGFSKLAEASRPAFWNGVTASMENDLDNYQDEILPQTS